MPFTRVEFFDVFAAYNEAVWPAQILLTAMAAAIAILAGAVRRGGHAAALLGALWLWAGLVYQIGFFAPINPAAWLFGTLFVLQAALLLHAWRRGLVFRARLDAAGITGIALAAYALVAYPLIAVAGGHPWPTLPTFGVPCPLVIFTFAALLWAEPPVPRHLLVIPTLWAGIGTFAALRLGVPGDYGLAVSAALALPLLMRRERTIVQRAAAPG